MFYRFSACTSGVIPLSVTPATIYASARATGPSSLRTPASIKTREVRLLDRGETQLFKTLADARDLSRGLALGLAESAGKRRDVAVALSERP